MVFSIRIGILVRNRKYLYRDWDMDWYSRLGLVFSLTESNFAAGNAEKQSPEHSRISTSGPTVPHIGSSPPPGFYPGIFPGETKYVFTKKQRKSILYFTSLQILSVTRHMLCTAVHAFSIRKLGFHLLIKTFL